ncbi:DUF397 domain-containing protein [Streptomyces sp. NPDC021093]|uniref:DUF397 domain-containing protein n=1 Tax=Streptomyces sp. NPDC021093 TaxID=3365112 RepID=UPI0037B84964
MQQPDLSSALWHKSTYSSGNADNCVEVAHDFPGAALWRKSTYSNAEGGSCVEVSDCLPGVVPVRDSKVPDGPILLLPAGSWSPFIDSLKQ